MIIKLSESSKTADVQGLVNLSHYLQTGRVDQPVSMKNRVANFFTVNMTSGDAQNAQSEMALNLSLNTRARQSKFLHIIASVPADDGTLSIDRWKISVNEILKSLDMNKQPCIVYEHKDTDCDHLHLIVSKVDLEDGHIISPFQSKIKLTRLGEKLEKQFKLTQTNHEVLTAVQFNGLSENEKEVLREEQSKKRALNFEKATGKPSLTLFLKSHKDDLKMAKSWNELHQILKHLNVKLIKKKGGIIFLDLNDEQIHCKGSDIDRSFSLKQLEKKFGMYSVAGLNTKRIDPVTDVFKERHVQTNSHDRRKWKRSAEITEKELVSLLKAGHDRVSIANDHISLNSKDPQYQTLERMLLLGQKKWGAVKATGEPNFQRRCAAIAAKHNISFSCADPRAMQIYNRHRREQQIVKVRHSTQFKMIWRVYEQKHEQEVVVRESRSVSENHATQHDDFNIPGPAHSVGLKFTFENKERKANEEHLNRENSRERSSYGRSR